MCLHQHGVRPRSMDIARQRHRLEFNQGQRKVMRPLSSHHRLPKSSMGVTRHPKSLWDPNGDYCSGINDIDVEGNRSLMILYASIFFCFAMFSAWHRLRNTRNWNSLTCPMKTCHSSYCSNNNTSNTNSNNNINSSSTTSTAAAKNNNHNNNHIKHKYKRDEGATIFKQTQNKVQQLTIRRPTRMF